MSNTSLDFSTPHMQLHFRCYQGRLELDSLAAGGHSWLHPAHPSALFGVTLAGQYWNATNLAFLDARTEAAGKDIEHTVFSFQGPGFTVRHNLKVYAGAALLECWPLIHNTGTAELQVDRIDSIAIVMPGMTPRQAQLLYYTGLWGSEFEPHYAPMPASITLETRTGRSSKGCHPWFALTDLNGQVLSGAVAWSGNWVIRFEWLASGGLALSGGLHDWQFTKALAPGETMEGAPFVLVMGKDLNAVSQQYARVGRRHWFPRNALSERLPVEWNHWWPYEDAEIDETVFAENIRKAAGMGFEVCTLDAGWFGPSDAGTFWEHYRGDWALVNAERFPSGIRPLADLAHAHGMAFGMWCEIEALGPKATLGLEHPEYVARRDGKLLGCVCFGSPAVQEWAYQTLSRLINDFGADWIKLDFNLDPGAGCNRTDHGHQPGDGLYEHYHGYYRTLERIHRDFPEVVLENCSSGGLRIDLGMLRHTHMTYLSDPDWPDHDLQIFWGASTMLAPDRLLHWTYSHWRNLNPPPYQKFNPHDPALTQKKWDYYSRISMLGLYGISQKLPELPAWMAERINYHNNIYKNHVRRFTKEGHLYRLTDQPLRSGEGDRWAAFQYSLPDESEHLLFVFRLPGGERQRSICLQNLEPKRVYGIHGFDNQPEMRMSGIDLMENGLAFSALEEEDSALLLLT
ncbi:MAG TPA: alpha-galactosidase [Levilinea sp.]|nr:alpha-galactosidase [Levilinea sp.]